MALGRVDPAGFDEDPGLRQLVDVVPFGLPAEPLRRVGIGPRELFGLPDRAVVALWGGGMWEWFDPALVVDAVAQARVSVPDLHLCLLGQQPAGRPPTAAALVARERAAALGVDGRSVHFATDWVPYDARQAWLLDADIAVSAHLEAAENRFSFRTRVLDYLWAGLPCVLSAGDGFAELAVRQNFGLVAAVGDVEGFAAALVALAGDADRRKRIGASAKATAVTFTWPRVAAALEAVLERLQPRAPRALRPAVVLGAGTGIWPEASVACCWTKAWEVRGSDCVAVPLLSAPPEGRRGDSA